jgi:hypothetical protein
MRTAITPVNTHAGRAIGRNRPVRQGSCVSMEHRSATAANEKRHLTLASLRGNEIEVAAQVLASPHPTRAPRTCASPRSLQEPQCRTAATQFFTEE